MINVTVLDPLSVIQVDLVGWDLNHDHQRSFVVFLVNKEGNQRDVVFEVGLQVGKHFVQVTLFVYFLPKSCAIVQYFWYLLVSGIGINAKSSSPGKVEGALHDNVDLLQQLHVDVHNVLIEVLAKGKLQQVLFVYQSFKVFEEFSDMERKLGIVREQERLRVFEELIVGFEFGVDH